MSKRKESDDQCDHEAKRIRSEPDESKLRELFDAAIEILDQIQPMNRISSLVAGEGFFLVKASMIELNPVVAAVVALCKWEFDGCQNALAIKLGLSWNTIKLLLAAGAPLEAVQAKLEALQAAAQSCRKKLLEADYHYPDRAGCFRNFSVPSIIGLAAGINLAAAPTRQKIRAAIDAHNSKQVLAFAPSPALERFLSSDDLPVNRTSSFLFYPLITTNPNWPNEAVTSTYCKCQNQEQSEHWSVLYSQHKLKTDIRPIAVVTIGPRTFVCQLKYKPYPATELLNAWTAVGVRASPQQLASCSAVLLQAAATAPKPEPVPTEFELQSIWQFFFA